eukprot:TRINITY_DN1180_c0_g1_i1.p1 TRINITY_DN1180_c0_g1~~TRINITY_DN1180_c0_g1_i1.p1  ORF type:complete len:293 (-),score=86.93 TRINITY_DN1180_c0_g1_i1:43-921(-)
MNPLGNKIIGTAIYSGQFLLSDNYTGEGGDTFICNISLCPTHARPSVFGAIRYSDKTVNILSGDWNSDDNSIIISELSTTQTGELRNFVGHVGLDSDNHITIVGTWSNSTNKGGFACREEDSNDQIHLTRRYEGLAEPNDTQRALIPKNPIHWVLTALITDPDQVKDSAKEEKETDDKKEEKKSTNNEANKEKEVFGAGYFDDSADLDSSPVLVFSVVGSWEPATGKLKLKKVYQASLETSGYEVLYDGVVSPSTGMTGEGNAYLVKGTWDNRMGGSFGAFSCLSLPERTKK